ncbi:MAG: ABC transporter substrate-binding protein [Clostridia bacterium]|nr:ABC transporter substrate-binding protein [Clostridia bacterium]
MHMKRFLLLLLALCVLCPAGGLAQEPLKELVIAEPVHLTGYLPLYVAMHKGYFEEQGLKVSVVQATGGAHVTAVVSGDAWGVIGGVDSSALASQGSPDPVTAVVNCVNRANVYLFAAKGLAPVSGSDEDLKAFLKGKTIVAGRYGGSPNLLTRYLLLKVGLDPDKDVTLLENADASTVNALIQMGQGQIGNGGEPQISEGIAAGIWEEPFYKFPDLGDFSYSVIGVKRSTIEEDPETVQKFVNAMLKALKVVHEEPNVAREVLDIEFSTMTEAGKEASLQRAYEDNLWSKDGWISQASVDLDMDVLIQSGIYEGEYSYDELVDMQFVERGQIME